MKKFLLAIILTLSAVAHAACPQFYPNSVPVTVPGTIELCNSFYVIVYDNNNNHPVFVSEHLSKGSGVGTIPRIGAFHSDPRVKKSPTNAIYLGSGFDKGHLAPADDGSTVDEVKDTFLLTNMTPQKPLLNRETWKALEMSVRKMYNSSSSDMWIVNIPVYDRTPEYLGGYVPIPKGYWKIVYVDGKVRNFFAENVDKAPIKEYTSINWLNIVGAN
jgi:endonuclease G